MSASSEHQAWVEGFNAGIAWRSAVDAFWETNDYGKSPAEPVNPYPKPIQVVHLPADDSEGGLP